MTMETKQLEEIAEDHAGGLKGDERLQYVMGFMQGYQMGAMHRDELIAALTIAVYEVKDWHEYNFNQIDSFDGNEREMQSDIAKDILIKLNKIKAAIKKATP